MWFLATAPLCHISFRNDKINPDLYINESGDPSRCTPSNLYEIMVTPQAGMMMFNSTSTALGSEPSPLGFFLVQGYQVVTEQYLKESQNLNLSPIMEPVFLQQGPGRLILMIWILEACQNTCRGGCSRLSSQASFVWISGPTVESWGKYVSYILLLIYFGLIQAPGAPLRLVWYPSLTWKLTS